jgi:hypothetical protein
MRGSVAVIPSARDVPVARRNTRHLHSGGVRVVEVVRPTGSAGAGTGSPTPKMPSWLPGPPKEVTPR